MSRIIESYEKYSRKFKGRNKPQLRFYAFDWDDNILFMSSKIHMDKLEDSEWIPEDVSTVKFAEVRNDSKYRIINNDPNLAFSEFTDSGPRGEDAFLIDVKEAIELKKFGPSWDDFIESLTNGSLFCIITARGHNPAPMRKAVEWIIETQLSDDQKNNMAANLNGFLSVFDDTDVIQNNRSFEELKKIYLDSCDFFGVMSPWFAKNVFPTSASNPEPGKKAALTLFAKKIEKFGQELDADVHLGFSDDDPGNVKAIKELFEDEPSLSKYLDYYIYDTGDNVKGIANENILTFESFREELDENENMEMCSDCKHPIMNHMSMGCEYGDCDCPRYQ
jgi:hypothetical protein